MNASRFQLHCDFIYTSALGLDRFAHTCTFLSQTLMQNLAKQVRMWMLLRKVNGAFAFMWMLQVTGRCYWRGVSQWSWKSHKNVKRCVLTDTPLTYSAEVQRCVFFYFQWCTTNHEHTLRGLMNKNKNTLHAPGHNSTLKVIFKDNKKKDNIVPPHWRCTVFGIKHRKQILIKLLQRTKINTLIAASFALDAWLFISWGYR